MTRFAAFQTTLEGWSVFSSRHGLTIALLLLIVSCSPPDRESAPGRQSQENQGKQFASIRLPDGRYKIWFSGETMGSTYNVTYLAESDRNHQAEIEAFFLDFNACLSTYDSSSLLSRWNRSELGLAAPEPCSSWFSDLLTLSLQVHEQSQGAFDPTVGPLLRYWGFFREDPFSGARTPDSAKVLALLAHVGLHRGVAFGAAEPDGAAQNNRGNTKPLSGHTITKKHPAVELDFNAIAPGYAADHIGRLLSQHGVSNYLVEVGGEVYASGLNDRGKPWTIAIEKPIEVGREAQILVGVANAGLATSGNYRKFWERDGVRYSHTLNPTTGYPERSALLSASVLAPSAAKADALATACMVLGLDRGLRLLEQTPDTEGYLIYLDAANNMAVAQTSGFGERTALPQP
jgi:thiamine biosynthesis lipoprotein